MMNFKDQRQEKLPEQVLNKFNAELAELIVKKNNYGIDAFNKLSQKPFMGFMRYKEDVQKYSFTLNDKFLNELSNDLFENISEIDVSSFFKQTLLIFSPYKVINIFDALKGFFNDDYNKEKNESTCFGHIKNILKEKKISSDNKVYLLIRKNYISNVIKLKNICINNISNNINYSSPAIIKNMPLRRNIEPIFLDYFNLFPNIRSIIIIAFFNNFFKDPGLIKNNNFFNFENLLKMGLLPLNSNTSKEKILLSFEYLKIKLTISVETLESEFNSFVNTLISSSTGSNQGQQQKTFIDLIRISYNQNIVSDNAIKEYLKYKKIEYIRNMLYLFKNNSIEEMQRQVFNLVEKSIPNNFTNIATNFSEINSKEITNNMILQKNHGFDFTDKFYKINENNILKLDDIINFIYDFSKKLEEKNISEIKIDPRFDHQLSLMFKEPKTINKFLIQLILDVYFEDKIKISNSIQRLFIEFENFSYQIQYMISNNVLIIIEITK